MIHFAIDGVPVAEIAANLIERALKSRPRNYLLDRNSNDSMKRAYRILRDKNGDPYRVYREAWRHRPGGGYLERMQQKVAVPAIVELPLLDRIKGYLASGKTQRGAAAELGISLGKLQRTLKKCAS
ncbi:MAG: hypothetical protein ACREDH_15635 [Methylocella sp.]